MVVCLNPFDHHVLQIDIIYNWNRPFAVWKGHVWRGRGISSGILPTIAVENSQNHHNFCANVRKSLNLSLPIDTYGPYDTANTSIIMIFALQLSSHSSFLLFFLNSLSSWSLSLHCRITLFLFCMHCIPLTHTHTYIRCVYALPYDTEGNKGKWRNIEEHSA